LCIAALCWPSLRWRRLPTYRKCLPIRRLLLADRFCRRARNCSWAHKIGVSCLAQCPVSTHLRDTSARKGLKNRDKSASELVALTTVIGTVGDRPNPPRRKPNAEVRAREYLTDAEVNGLIVAAGNNRNGHRDATMVRVAYRHGLRSAELVTLRWDAVDFAHGRLHVRRLKGGSESVHPLSGRELRALRRLKREQEPDSPAGPALV
jgi:integrase